MHEANGRDGRNGRKRLLNARVLVTLLLALTVVLAGCSGISGLGEDGDAVAEADTPNDGASGNGTDDNTTAAGDDEDSADNGGDDSSENDTTTVANDSGAGGDNGVNTSDDGASGNGADDNTTAAGDNEDSAGDDTDENTTVEGDGEDGTGEDIGENDSDGENGDDATETESDEEDNGDAGDGDGNPAIEEVIEEADSYEFEIVTKNGGDYRGEGRAHDGNTYTQWESGSETYLVDGQIYDINPELGLCMLMEEENSEEGSIGNIYEDVERVEITFAGTDTIDGEQVYVYKYTQEVSAEAEHEMTIYVSVETGYVLRLESGDLVTNYHSHGEADPIEAPDTDDIECIEISEENI